MVIKNSTDLNVNILVIKSSTDLNVHVFCSLEIQNN